MAFLRPQVSILRPKVAIQRPFVAPQRSLGAKRPLMAICRSQRVMKRPAVDILRS